jgi:selenocysteine lyase/cysteine desulfurase
LENKSKPMNPRRSFLRKFGVAAGALSLHSLISPLLAAEMEERKKAFHSLPLDDSPTHEDFWAWIRNSYDVSATLLNLNNGGVSPQPVPVQEAHIKFYKLCNEAPSFYMWRILDQGRESLRAKLAQLGGCSPEEIAINRNSTEGLNSVIFGLNLKAGDEVVLSKYDYPNMMNAWKQREKRDGIKLVWVDLPLPSDNDKVLLAAFERAMTSKTKVVHITQVINWTGQILPTKAICSAAKSRGCEVIVDGAHSFAHLDFSIPELGCDYFATSLHKWLGAPFGSGMLYIKKDKIKNVWALLSNDHPDGEDIRKFESLGTRSFASEMAIANAIDFHNLMGTQRKEKRLRYLKDYWAVPASKIPGVKLNTPLNPAYSGAIANVSVEGWDAVEMESKLQEKFRIHTVAIKYEKINGIRVTPNVYTSKADLDRFLEGLQWLSKNKPGK